MFPLMGDEMLGHSDTQQSVKTKWFKSIFLKLTIDNKKITEFAYHDGEEE
jgi:hypothetical protein